MKVIVAGGRDFTNALHMDRVIKSLGSSGFIDANAQLVCGMARGADLTAYELWRNVYKLPVAEYYADWSLGRSAGITRNTHMAHYADKLIAFWDGRSKGTSHMIRYMGGIGKPIHIEYY